MQFNDTMKNKSRRAERRLNEDTAHFNVHKLRRLSFRKRRNFKKAKNTRI